jgi:hypothetical protein
MTAINLYSIFVLWINLILSAVPVRLVRTYSELVIGATISGSGHITQALLAIGHQKHFSTYYWLIEKGKWAWLRVTRELISVIVRFFPRAEWNLIIDDFICPRASKKAPEVKYHHEHGRKPNRPQYIWGQQWVALGLSLTWGKITAALPLILRLHKYTGNHTKITTALTLIRAVHSLFRRTGKETIRCLVDAWYMKGSFILPLVRRGIHVIGNVRIDTVLFKEPNNLPVKHRKRGRPRKYGDKFTAALIQTLPVQQTILNIYGGRKLVTYRWTPCLARFLKGLPVIAVWCKFDDQKNWTLLISTDLNLTPEQIIKLYARRWKIEPMFNEIKHSYGVAHAWEQTPRSLHRWVSIICAAYTLTRMLALLAQTSEKRDALPIIQWRVNKPITSGMMKMGLQLFFRRYSFSRLWNQKSKKLMM